MKCEFCDQEATFHACEKHAGQPDQIRNLEIELDDEHFRNEKQSDALEQIVSVLRTLVEVTNRHIDLYAPDADYQVIEHAQALVAGHSRN
jgi:hypothetical protein